MMQSNEVDIRSETQVALTDDMTERIVNFSNRTPDTIVLRTRRRNYPIKVSNFARCSEKVALLVQRKEIPPTIDLSCYNIGAVRTLTDFVAGIDQRNLRLGENILTDLLQLARIFRMRQLTSLIVEHVIEKVEKGPPSNLLLALNLVSSDWSMFLHTNEALALVETAAENINEVTTSTFFNMLPAAVLVMLYSRCDVNISSEIELSQRLIRWLKKMIRTNDDAEMLFACVRTPFLSAKDRDVIREKCIGLPLCMINVIERTLDSPRNHRCCVIREHVIRRYPRCGIPDNNIYLKINTINLTTKPLFDKDKKGSKAGGSPAARQSGSGVYTARASPSGNTIEVSPIEGRPSPKVKKPHQKQQHHHKPKYDGSRGGPSGQGSSRRRHARTHHTNEGVENTSNADL